MSRLEFTTDHADGSRNECTVGWDRPLNTFFAQVFHFPAGVSAAEEPVLWIGTSHSEILDPAVIVEAITPYCNIPGTLSATLHFDRMATAGQQNSALQDHMLRLLKG